jgi:hypothetical protein
LKSIAILNTARIGMCVALWQGNGNGNEDKGNAGLLPKYARAEHEVRITSATTGSEKDTGRQAVKSLITRTSHKTEKGEGHKAQQTRADGTFESK